MEVRFFRTRTCYRKPKHVVQNEKSGHKNPNNSHNSDDEIILKYNSIKETVKGAHNGTQHLNSSHSKTSPIYCIEVQLTNAQCHIASLFIVWYRVCCAIQLICTFETKQEKITVSCHQHTSMATSIGMPYTKTLFQCAAMIYGVFIIDVVFRPEPRSGSKSSNPLVRCLFLDLLLMGLRGCASAMGEIKTPILLF